MTKRRKKIVHVINSLDRGGAEKMLFNLVNEMDQGKIDSEVISLRDKGPIALEIKKLGIPVHSVNIGLFNWPLELLWIIRWLRRAKPDIVMTWMYHANIIGGLANWFSGRAPLIWSLHATQLDPVTLKSGTFAAIRVGKYFCRVMPDAIICCCPETKSFHEGMGYKCDQVIVVPNGFDLAQFHPDSDARISVRKELGLAANTLLIGMSARFHPNKDFRNFIMAATKLHQKRSDIHFVCCGQDITSQNEYMENLINEFGASEFVSLLGNRDDMPRLMASLDISTLTSFIGEAFPLVIGEAMACGVPCVATDVGGVKSLIGDTGTVVGVRDPEALADAWEEILNMPEQERGKVGQMARDRVAAKYSIKNVTQRYEELISEAVSDASLAN